MLQRLRVLKDFSEYNMWCFIELTILCISSFISTISAQWWNNNIPPNWNQYLDYLSNDTWRTDFSRLQLYKPDPTESTGENEFDTLESPLSHFRREDDELYGAYQGSYFDTTSGYSNQEQSDLMTTTEQPTTTTEEPTTTLAPFTIGDVKVPPAFLRIEYMISYAFLGTMYGLGFFVFFQSLCVPAAKIAVTVVYLILIHLKAIKPISLEHALEQLPPI